MAVTPCLIQYVENASHFRISSYPTSFVKEVRIKKTFIGTQHAVPKEALPGFAAQKSPVVIYNDHSVSFLKCGIGGARCTCFSQNEAIPPRGVRAVCSRSGSKSVGLRCGYPRYYIHHCRGDHWSSENVRLTPYGATVILTYKSTVGTGVPDCPSYASRYTVLL